MMKLLRWSLTVCLMLLAVAARAAGPDEVVGMVLDVQGNGELLRQGRTSKLQLLSYIKPGTQLKIDAGAKASVSHYGAKLIYQLTGPVQAEVDAERLKVVSGAPAVTKSLAEKVVAAAVNPNMGAAAFKMRGLGQEIAMLAPTNRSVQLTLRPRFQWSAPEPASYQLTVIEAPERVIARATVDGSSWELPANVKLQQGKDYRWSVSYTPASDGQMRSAGAEFSVATQAESDATLALKPGAGAAVDEWVLYAAILRDRQMLDEARQVWREIASQRPDLATAHTMAR
ncbi:MAG: hypothetical protein V4724_35950 [Pseudomonadota bacterium]